MSFTEEMKDRLVSLKEELDRLGKVRPEKPQEEKVRALMVVEFRGDRSAVEAQLRQGLRQGQETTYGRVVVNRAILGMFPEVLDGSAARAVDETLKANEVFEEMLRQERVSDTKKYLGGRVPLTIARADMGPVADGVVDFDKSGAVDESD